MRKNYYCAIKIHDFKKFLIICKEYEHKFSAYQGHVCLKDYRHVGWFYLASHPETGEMVMRFDIFSPKLFLKENPQTVFDETKLC